MSRLEKALGALVRDLDRQGARAALVGGLAVSARSEPRFTRDIDMVVAVASDAEAESIVHALVGQGYEILAVVEHETQHRLATARLVTPSEGQSGVVADLLFASSGIEAEIVTAAERLEIFAGLALPVACAGHLAALKLLAADARTRPQDAVDLRALREIASDEEIARAGSAARLIEERAFARGRDLTRAVAEWRDSAVG